jgi:hypothetical protein
MKKSDTGTCQWSLRHGLDGNWFEDGDCVNLGGDSAHYERMQQKTVNYYPPPYDLCNESSARYVEQLIKYYLMKARYISSSE